MGDLNLRGGTVVTAEGTFAADVAVRGGRIAAVGATVPDDGAETVDVSGLLRDAGLHRRPHPHGHAVRRDDHRRRLGLGHGGGRRRGDDDDR